MEHETIARRVGEICKEVDISSEDDSASVAEPHHLGVTDAQRPHRLLRKVSTSKELRILVSLKEGYLLKQSKSFQRWRRRYFKLKGRKLFYAPDKESPVFNEIDLTDLSVAACGSKNANSFQVISSNASCVLCADSRKEMEDWLLALKTTASQQYYESGADHYRCATSGEHTWFVCSHSRPTYCNLCREALSGMAWNGLSCEVCKLKSHKRCGVKITQTCKWTTLDSMDASILIKDENGALCIPHQWSEGNLPMSAKCAVCDKTCGSVLRLLDWRCLWCRTVVHSACKEAHPNKCLMGPARLSVLPPVSIQNVQQNGAAELTNINSGAGSPLLVFVNSKSGDNQGVKVLRKFKRLLNPAQVFDLMNGGPEFGLRFFQIFESFRVVVCGGDGSVTWVFTALDRLNLHHKCQLGIVPLGTGNDLARVLGWGHSLDDDAHLPLILDRFERAHTKMMDRWSVMMCDAPIPSKAYIGQHKSSITRYEDSVANHLSQILCSEDHTAVIGSARVLCETVKDFVTKVGEAYKLEEEHLENPTESSMSNKCSVLEQKLQGLLKTLQAEEMRAEAAETSGIEPEESSSSDSVPELSPKPSARLLQRQFIQKEAVMNRANSLKKAIRQIIEHAESAVDEQQSMNIQHPLRKSKRRKRWGHTKSRTLPIVPTIGVRDSTSQEERTEDETYAIRKNTVETDRPSTSGAHFARVRLHGRVSDSDSTVPDDPTEHHPRRSKQRTVVLNKQPKPYSNTQLTANEDSYVDSSTTPGLMTSDDDQQGPYCISPMYSLAAHMFPEDLPSSTRSSPLPHPQQVYLRRSVSNLSLTEVDQFECDTSLGSRKISMGTESPITWTEIRPGLVPDANLPSTVGGGVIAEVLLLNADVLGVAASPLMDFERIPQEKFQEVKVMNNYFGIGLDAKIALEFQQKRDGYGDKARSRSKLLMWYGMLGTKELLARTYKNLEQRVHVECDGQRIQLPSLQGLVILNIPSYQGGMNFWGASKTGGNFFEQSYDDRILEVVAVFSVMHCATSRVTSKVVRLQNHRIAQCREVKIIITGDEPIPVQVDGEPWMQSPSYIHIKHKNRAQVLVRNRHFEATLRTWAERQARLQQKPPACLLAMFNEEEAIEIVGFIETVHRWLELVHRLCEEYTELQNDIGLPSEQLHDTVVLMYPPSKKLQEIPHLHMALTDLVAGVRQLANRCDAYLSGIVSEDEPSSSNTRAVLGEGSKRALEEQLSTVADESRHISKILAFSHSVFSLPQVGTSTTHLIQRGIGTRSSAGISSVPISNRSLPLAAPTIRSKAKTFSLSTWIRSTTSKLGRQKSGSVSEICTMPAASTWSVSEVSDWMRNVGLNEFVHVFAHHDIDGAELMRLERRDFKEMGISKVGHIKRIERAIQILLTTPPVHPQT